MTRDREVIAMPWSVKLAYEYRHNGTAQLPVVVFNIPEVIFV